MKRLTIIPAALTAILAAGLTTHAQDPQTPAHPYFPRAIYSETANPRTDIAAGLKEARLQHKRVLLDFGGDWCGDCQVLDIYFHEQPNSALLAKNFVLVHVFIGHLDKNIDLAAHYGVPLGKGVPALAVLDETGKVLTSQRTGEFNNMRHMDQGSVTAFLNKWKA